jgi:hypothetical protein
MRIAAIRSDIQKIYLNDIENRSQRCFSSEPAGQSRYFAKPSSSEITSVLEAFAPATLLGSNTSASVNTSAGANVLLIKDTAAGSNVTITVTSGATTAKTVIAADLNAGFAANGLKLSARVAGSNKIAIDTTAGNLGPGAYIKVDASSTLETVLGLSTTAVVGTSTATVVSAVYPTPTTVNVSESGIGAIAGYTNMDSDSLAALAEALQAVVAPLLIETGPVLLSFAYGNIAGFSSSTFQPGGERGGLEAGAAIYVLQDDGGTHYTL